MRGPSLHLFVCVNRRTGASELFAPGCGASGEAVYDAMKAEVSKRGRVVDVWVTKTGCLGLCPREGASVAVYPSRDPIRPGLTAAEVPALFETPPPRDDDDDGLEEVEALQREKVLDLARRLKPGLTLEDVQNPHDFPELDDPDWHYADGVLTGIQAARAALRARSR